MAEGLLTKLVAIYDSNLLRSGSKMSQPQPLLVTMCPTFATQHYQRHIHQHRQENMLKWEDWSQAEWSNIKIIRLFWPGLLACRVVRVVLRMTPTRTRAPLLKLLVRLMVRRTANLALRRRLCSGFGSHARHLAL